MAEAPIASHEGGQAAVKALNASRPPTTDRVDKLYRQLVEIHAITAAQLAECPTGTALTPLLAWSGPGMSVEAQ
jgi:hypothetical protein